MGKKERWTVKVKRDAGWIKRTDWRGRQLPNGYEGHLKVNGESRGFVFGKTEAEVLQKAEEQKQSFLQFRRFDSEAKVYAL